ncbi:MAG: hypothetical protein WBL44_07660 [Nitrososphaeraceae archaeon]
MAPLIIIYLIPDQVSNQLVLQVHYVTDSKSEGKQVYSNVYGLMDYSDARKKILIDGYKCAHINS